MLDTAKIELLMFTLERKHGPSLNWKVKGRFFICGNELVLEWGVNEFRAVPLQLRKVNQGIW